MPEPTSPTRVYLWIVNPPDSASDISQVYFSTEEQARAARLCDPSQQQNLLRRRLFIHETVAPVFGLHPHECSISHKTNGQPHLVSTTSPVSVYLSISTSDDFFAIAASSDCPVGIDIESILAPDDALDQRILSARELADINSRDTTDAAIALTTYWTRKEAYLKLHGLGLRVEPHKIEIPLLPSDWLGQWQQLVFDPAYSVISWNQEQHIISLCAPTRPLPVVVVATRH